MTRTRSPYKRRAAPKAGPFSPEPGQGRASDPGNQDMTGYATLGRAIGMMAKGMGQ